MDKNIIDSLVSEIKALTGEQLDNRVEAILATRSILAPEQFQKFNEKMEEMREKHKMSKGRFHEKKTVEGPSPETD